jgi:anti-sigma-K factor RskA
MNVDDQNAGYLATGEGHPSGQAANLDHIRAVLGDPDTWAVPPDEVQGDVLAAIQSGSPARGDDSLMAGWLPRLAAVAAIAVLAIALMALWPSGTQVELIGTELAPEASGVAVLDATGSGWEIQVDLSDLPPAEPGTYYEGWVWSDDGSGVSIGTFHLQDASERITLWSGVDVAEYPSIWISLQQESAGNEVSDEIVMRGRIEG